MIVVGTLREPVEVDFSDLLPGVKMVLRRLDSMDFAEAREAARKTIEDLQRGAAALSEFGLDAPDRAGRRINLADPAQMFRIGHLVGSVEIAVRAVASWSGITSDKEGSVVAPISREVLTLLLMQESVERRLLAEVDKAARILVLEGNA